MKFLISKNQINESCQPIQPKRVLDEIDEIDNSLDDNISKEIVIPKDVLDSFQIKDTLNTEIWIDNTLNPKVKDKLLKIATDFYSDLELPSEVQILDIIFTGSLANFNWSKFSDIDLHIIIDFKKIDGDPQMIQDFFREKKSNWSLNHNIKIFGYPVEMYIQDKHAKHISSAIYSVLKDKWNIIPKHENFKIDKDAVKRKAKFFINQLRTIKKTYVNDDHKTVVKMATYLKDKIKRMRNAGLENGGEFSLENIVFKTLRRTPFMDQLDSFKNKAYDELMSINENVNEPNENNLSFDVISNPNPYGDKGYPEIIYVTALLGEKSVGRIMLFRFNTEKELKNQPKLNKEFLNIQNQGYSEFLSIGEAQIISSLKKTGIYTKLLTHTSEKFNLPIFSSKKTRTNEADMFWNKFKEKINIIDINGNYILYPNQTMNENNMKNIIKEKLNTLSEVKYIKQSNYVNTTDKTTYIDKKAPEISKQKMSPIIAAKKERKDNITPKQQLSISDKEKQDVLDRQEQLAAKYANKKRG